MPENWTHYSLKGVATAVLSFALLGTVSALWENPLFIRMTPVEGFETMALAAQSLLLGLFVAIPRSSCATPVAGTGGVLGFLGIACPICNKILVLLFGTELLLSYLEPARPYLAMAGVVITAMAVAIRLRARGSAIASTS